MMHFGRVESSPKLMAMLSLLRERGPRGATTLELSQVSGSMAPATDVSALRKNGLSIEAEYESMNPETRSRIWRYWLVG